MKLRLLGAVCACLVNGVQATSISSAGFDWNTFTITAGGADITGSVVWLDVPPPPGPFEPGPQSDLIRTEYIEGEIDFFLGTSVTTEHNIRPNTGWGTSQLRNDGGIATDAITSVSPSLVSATTEVNYTGRSEIFMSRVGTFTAPVDGLYAFSVGYSLFAEVNGTNSESGGGQNSLIAHPGVDLTIINYTSGVSDFSFDESVDVVGFGSDSGAGTLIVDGTNGGALFSFAAGDQIDIRATASSDSRSWSSEEPPATVPVPPALALFMSGLGALVAFGRRAVHAA